MKKRKIKLLFVRPWISSFIQNDLELLRKHFDVRVVDFVLNVRERPKDTIKTMLNMIKGILWADLIFSWFASTHAFWAVRLSKIFRKKSIVVVGGYEVANVPEIEYGAMSNPKSARRVKYVLENANKILAVSEFNKKEILMYINPKKVELVYNGVDYDKFKLKNEKEDLVITVGYVVYHAIKRKRYDIFVKAAKYLPNVKFVLIGEYVDNSIEYLKSLASPNVEFTGFVSNEELLKYYQKAKVYCQLSMYESFGIAPAEAMLCGCVPVVTHNAALPEVVGDTGFYSPYGDEKATAEVIKEALKSDKGKEARERIKNTFSLEKREERLVEIIRGLIKEGKQK
jgi:glycosyltransferase involved in cell wall biosynthesis